MLLSKYRPSSFVVRTSVDLRCFVLTVTEIVLKRRMELADVVPEPSIVGGLAASPALCKAARESGHST
jgi:hypothetical protein